MFADFVNLDTISPSGLASIRGFGIGQWCGLALRGGEQTIEPVANMWLASRRTNSIFSITVYIAIATCLLIISFSDLRALVFEAVLLGIATFAYYVSLVINQI